jgi:hypothetical protein
MSEHSTWITEPLDANTQHVLWEHLQREAQDVWNHAMIVGSDFIAGRMRVGYSGGNAFALGELMEGVRPPTDVVFLFCEGGQRFSAWRLSTDGDFQQLADVSLFRMWRSEAVLSARPKSG